MNIWLFVCIAFLVCIFVVCFFVEIASVFSLDEEYMDEYRLHKNQGRKKASELRKKRKENA